MLIEFSVSNFRSIHKRQTLSMAASSYFKELDQLNTFNAAAQDRAFSLVRSSVLYGPNASGKSTLIKALKFMETQVVSSHRSRQAGEEIDVTPFKLSVESRQSDSEFNISFIEDSIRYEYGFRCNRRRFTEEWLYAYPLGRPQKWFHRIFRSSANEDEYKFSDHFLGGRQRQIWKTQTRPNALFLSTAVQLNNEQIKPAFNWFKSRLRVLDSPSGVLPSYTLNRCSDDNDRKKVVDFMNSADLSIADIKIKETLFNSEALPKGMPIAVREHIAKELDVEKIYEPKFFHRSVDSGELIEFDDDEESEGTQALFAFAGPWLDVIENERVLVVDELDTSLHPLLVHHLVRKLHHEGTKAQLIFTTHDTTLLSQKLFRRDQIWFVEKPQETGATHLYPLSDFSARENEALERGYLNGRYGGIPSLIDEDFYGI